MLTLAAAPASMPATLPTTQPVAEASTGEMIYLVVMITLTIGGLVVAVVRYGVLRPSKVAGPERAPRPLQVWPLWVGFAASIVGIFVVTFFLMAVTAPKALEKKSDKPSTEIELSDSDLAINSVVPPVVTVLLVAGILVAISPGSLSAIGMSARTLPGGIVIGLLAAVVIIPWVFVSGEILERVYRAVQFNHPGEHDLLRVMNTKDSFLKWLAISAAVIVAPICEEFVFRGLLQTAITEGILRLLDPRRGEPAALAAMQQPVISPTQEMSQAMLLGAPPPPDASLAAANPVTQPSSLPLQYERGAYPRHWAAWIGIILTSALFALVHPLWTTPLIFVLAVGLGYVYERTGKLWVPMTVHATFNMISTITYLLILH